MWRRVAVCVVGFAAPTVAQEPANWQLGRVALQVGPYDFELHRVTSAVMLSDGAIAIGDAGNRRIVIAGRARGTIRTVGAEGAGPGEFSSIWRMYVLGDTIIAHDPGLSRLSFWTANGELLDTRALPGFDDRPVELSGVLGTAGYIGRSLGSGISDRRGLFRTSAAIVTIEAGARQWRPLETREWDYLYFYPQGGGASTTYRTPFLASALLAAKGDRYFFVPRDSAIVEVVSLSEGRRSSVRIPLVPRPFDRRVVQMERDSLLRSARGSSAERIRDVYSDEFPAPQLAPSIRTMMVLGDELWLERFPQPGDSEVVWYVVDPDALRVLGRIVLPRDVRLLGGSGREVILLARDELDVEYVLVREVIRN